MLNRALLDHCTANLHVDDEAFARFETYAELLVETNRQFNLTAITEPDDMTVKHFADCLSLFMQDAIQIPQGAKCIDVGTGAGFPGLVMKLYRPDLDVTFLDGTQKKLGFIESVLQATGQTGTILHMRAEEAGQNPLYRAQFDIVTARAVSAMQKLAEYCLPLVKVGGSFLAMKAADSEDCFGTEPILKRLGGTLEQELRFSLTEGVDRRILLVKKISQTPSKYPRPSAKIAKFPLQ